MPLDYKVFPPYLVIKRVREALQNIDPANGYNTRVKVGAQFIPPDAVEELPFVCVDPAILAGGDQLFGTDPSETFTEDGELGFVVYGYYEDEVNKEVAMWALLTDIISAVWADETLNSASAGVDLVSATWDLADMKDAGRGVLAVQFKARVLFDRGG